MATTITFPFYIKTDFGSVYTKMLSPYELIEVITCDNNSMIHRVNGDDFTGAYRAFLKDDVSYSNKMEFDEQFTKAVERISPALSMHQKIHLN